jgi:aspartyl-tRNA(Asn)/glutamyl-tRNA(Gln) amidotransferase subunit A
MLKQVRRSILDGETTCRDLVGETLERIKSNDTFNIFLNVFESDSKDRANAVDEKIGSGLELPLAGCIMGVKDILCMEGKKVTCGSHILEHYVSSYSATVIEKLENAGAVIVGKLNMDEFAMGSSNENSYFGPVKNPVDPERVPGGSSGGSAAAVAADLVPVTLGTDTGGSIRQPAAFCGVVGLKPTYGRVSRFGMVAFASSLDQIGPLGKNVDDISEILKVIAGHDHRDSTSVDTPVPDYPKELENLDSISDLRIGVPRDYFGEGLDPEINDAVTQRIEKLKSRGVSVGDVALPHSSYSVAAYYIIANAEASSNLARYDGARYGFRNKDTAILKDMYLKSRSNGFGDEVKRRIILGTYVLSAGYYDAYYRKAQKVRRLIYQDFNKVFRDFDVLITPTAPTPPYKIGEKINNPLEMYLGDIYTIPVNLAGLPGLVVPCGKTASGLPIGLQIIGKHFDEVTIMKLGKYLENMK